MHSDNAASRLASRSIKIETYFIVCQ